MRKFFVVTFISSNRRRAYVGIPRQNVFVAKLEDAHQFITSQAAHGEARRLYKLGAQVQEVCVI